MLIEPLGAVVSEGVGVGVDDGVGVGVVCDLLKFAVTLFGPVILKDTGLLLPLKSPLQYAKV
jgi:hypothetical protein